MRIIFTFIGNSDNWHKKFFYDREDEKLNTSFYLILFNSKFLLNHNMNVRNTLELKGP